MFNQYLNLLKEPHKWCPLIYLPLHTMDCTAGTLSYKKFFHQGGFKRMKSNEETGYIKESEVFCCEKSMAWMLYEVPTG